MIVFLMLKSSRTLKNERSEKGVVYVLGIAQSRAELDQVIELARVSGARKIVSHVFLTEHIVLDGAPEPTAGAKAEPEPVRAGGEPARVSVQTDEMKAKPDAKGGEEKAGSPLGASPDCDSLTPYARKRPLKKPI